MLTLAHRCCCCKQLLYCSAHGICSFCVKVILRYPLSCYQCGLPKNFQAQACHFCAERVPSWTTLLAVTPYQGELKRLILLFKLDKQPALARSLARLMLLRWLDSKHSRTIQIPNRLISIPLHHSRCWKRGFNQSDLLSHYLSRWTGYAWSSESVQRVRATPTQRTLSAKERRHNLHNAFRVKTALNNQHVAIVDDVVTTGSTVAEMSRVLLENGAASVQIWCLCRAL